MTEDTLYDVRWYLIKAILRGRGDSDIIAYLNVSWGSRFESEYVEILSTMRGN